MGMQEIVDIIISYTAIWGPAILAIAGIIITVLKCMTEIRRHVEDLKNDTDLKDVKDNTAEIMVENKELIRCNKLLLDQLTKIQGYADAKDKET